MMKNMRILIFSDSHGKNDNMEHILNTKRPYDMVLHVGDIEGFEYDLPAIAGVETHIVRGNCDFFCDLPIEKTVLLGENTIYMRHGDGYVNSNPESLLELTEANIIIFGHTHVPYYKEVNGRHLFNPGSISKPRTADRIPSYGLLEIDNSGKINFQHIFLN